MSKIDLARLPKLWSQGLSSTEIAEIFGVTRPAVNFAARRMGLAPRSRGGDQRSVVAAGGVDLETLRALHVRGLSARKIAQEMGWSYPSVLYWRQNIGLGRAGSGAGPCQDAPVPAPDATPDAGLSPLEVDVMRSAGRLRVLADVAALHGVSSARVLQVWHRLRVAA